MLLDANGAVIGDYDFGGSYTILLINSIYYQLHVNSSGFLGPQITNAYQDSIYFTTADCTGTAYYETIGNNSGVSFSNRENWPIVYGNKLYKQDPSQGISLTPTSRQVVGGLCYVSGILAADTETWYAQLMNLVTHIVIEDLSIYPTPFSIKAN